MHACIHTHNELNGVKTSMSLDAFPCVCVRCVCVYRLSQHDFERKNLSVRDGESFGLFVASSAQTLCAIDINVTP